MNDGQYIKLGELNELREKAKRMDYLEKCHPMITATEIDELKEKAKKYDNLSSGSIAMGFTLEQANEWEEKAKSWDDMFKDGSSWDDVLKWKEKAEKWDTFEKYGDSLILSWKKKAEEYHGPNNCELCGGGFHEDIKLHKICDGCQKTWYSGIHVGKIILDKSEYAELKDKAKNWDDLSKIYGIKTTTEIIEWKEKAKSWDELVNNTNWSESSGMGKMGYFLEWRRNGKMLEEIRKILDQP